MVDTTVLIDVLRGREEAVALLQRLPERPLASEVTRIEVLRGMRAPERGATRRLLSTLDWVPIDAAVADRAGRLGRRWRRSHPGLALADLVIAATAEERSASLLTSNVRHYPMMPGLTAPY